ncbi:MAG: ankyrin repeat domain-containing protein [Thermoguttaceae bacterium]
MSPWTSLHSAVRSGDVAELRELVETGADLEATTKLGWTPLHFAAKHANLDCCQTLIDAGASMMARTQMRGWTPCHIAALEGHTAIVALCIEHGFDQNTVTPEGWTPLHAAVEHAHVETVRFLLQNGANPNLAKRQHTATFPLHSAARNGRRDIVKLLIQYGAEINVYNKRGKTPRDLADANGFQHLLPLFDNAQPAEERDQAITRDEVNRQVSQGNLAWVQRWYPNGGDSKVDAAYVLFIASLSDQIDIVRYLLESGVNPNPRSNAPLYFLLTCKRFERHDIMTLLIQHGADPNLRDAEGLTACERWEQREISPIPLELLELLVSRGVQLPPKHLKTAPLRWAVKTQNHAQAEALLKDGADPNATFAFDNELPLYVAIKNDDVAMVRLLLQYGARCNKKVLDKSSAMIHEAADRGNLEIVKMLVESGAPVNGTIDGYSPLHAAASEGHTVVVDYLIEQGASVAARPNSVLGRPTGTTSAPIFDAIRSRNSELIQVLIDKGADLFVVDQCRETLLHRAVEHGLTDWVKFFIDRGLDIEAKNRFGYTPLQIAACHRHDDIARFLLERGASTTPPATVSSFIYAIMLHRNDLLEEALRCNPLEASRPSEAHDSNLWNKTPLVIALEHGNESAVELLLAYGASITGAKISAYQEGAWGDSALTYVCRMGMKGMLERFLREKINVNAKASVLPALHAAANTEIAELLLSHGANPYLRSNEHKTALECQSHNNAPVAALLREVMMREP